MLDKSLRMARPRSLLFLCLAVGSKWAVRLRTFARLIVYGVIDGIISMMPVHSAAAGVLIVRLDAIGDFVLWQRGAVHYRSIYPGQRMVLVANAAWASLAKQLPYWDDVVALDVPRLQVSMGYRLKTFVALRRQGFAAAIQPTHSRSIFVGDSVIRVSGAHDRIGADGDLSNMTAWQRRLANRWYTRLIPSGGLGLTEIEHNRQFLSGLGWNDRSSPPADDMPRVAILPLRLRFDRAYFVVFPGASWTGRQWPAEEFARLIDATCNRHAWLPVLCGSASERELCARIAGSAQSPAVNLAGQTSLSEFCELVRGANLLVGNETSAIHIAAAVGTPSVCLLGGGHFGRFVPYPADSGGQLPEAVYMPMPCFGCNWNCYLPRVEGGAVPCVAAITLEAVNAAIERVTSRSNHLAMQVTSK